MPAHPIRLFRPTAWPFLAFGNGLLAAAAVCLAKADAHMAALGRICGGATPHCAWCGAADLLIAAGVASLALGLRAGGVRRAVAA